MITLLWKISPRCDVSYNDRHSHLYTHQFVPVQFNMVVSMLGPSAFGWPIGFNKVKRTRKSVSSVCFQVSLTTGASFIGILVLLNLLYVIPFLLIPLVNMAIAALALCPQTDASSCLSGARWDSSLLCFIEQEVVWALAVSIFCFAVDVLLLSTIGLHGKSYPKRFKSERRKRWNNLKNSKCPYFGQSFLIVFSHSIL